MLEFNGHFLDPQEMSKEQILRVFRGPMFEGVSWAIAKGNTQQLEEVHLNLVRELTME